MTAVPETQALERVPAKTPALIKTPDEFHAAMMRWTDQKLNVLTPFTNFSGLAEGWGIQSSKVLISIDPAMGDVYTGLPFLKKDEYAIAKRGLRKLAEGVGVSTQTQRTDNRSIANYWEFKAVASYRGTDGSSIVREATMEWDLRDGSPRLKGWSQNQIEEGRKSGLRNCEARAINAAIRECGCGIKQKYTRAELEKPFAVFRVVFDHDMSIPEVRLAVTQAALGGTAALYPPSQPALTAAPLSASAPDDDSDDEPRSVGSGSTVRGATSSSAAPRVDPDPPPTADAVRIMDITEKSGTNAATNRKWTKYSIVDSRGVEHSTFSKTMSEDAARLRDAKAWVEIEDEETDGPFSNLVEIRPATPPGADDGM